MAKKAKTDCLKTEKCTAEIQRAMFTKKHSEKEFESHIIKKYFILCDKLKFSADKFSKFIMVLKIIVAVLFVAFTVVAIAAGNHSGSKMLWLSVWIVLIFIFVFVFLIADYLKNVSFKTIIDFIENVNETEFKNICIDDLTEVNDENDI